jgi:hypothetical protein
MKIQDFQLMYKLEILRTLLKMKKTENMMLTRKNMYSLSI